MSQAITSTTRPDGVAVLTFDQPGSKANVLTRELWTEFGESLAGLAPRTELKGLVLASAKPGIFIAGADLKLLANAPGPNDPEVRAFIEQGLRVLEQLEALPFPTCAAIDGAALGGGLEVALACDYRVCGTNPKVQLGLPEVKLGLIPGWGGTQRLPRIIGISESSEMLISGHADEAETCLNSRLLDRAVKSDRMIDEAAATVLAARAVNELRARRRTPLSATEQENTLAAGSSSTAAREALRVLEEGVALSLADAIKLETEAFMRLAGSDESKRLIAEFFASRKK
jgi:enoyl-CoA hydratase/carnithine racemase